MDAVVGTKPNHSHSSSSNFHVDRFNNCLHYTIDNVRWTDSGNFFKNKAFNPAAYTTSTTYMTTILKAIQTQGRNTRHMLKRIFNKLNTTDLWPSQLQHNMQSRGLPSSYLQYVWLPLTMLLLYRWWSHQWGEQDPYSMSIAVQYYFVPVIRR